MSLWGKVAGAAIGLALGGPIGALAGALAGHMLVDRPRNGPLDPAAARQTVAFTIGMVALAAKMAKADGVVTLDEVAAFREIFAVDERDAAAARRVFELAQQDVAGFDAYARQIADLLGHDKAALEDVLEGLFHIAKADRAVHELEHAYLADVATVFGFDDAEFRRILARHVRLGPQNAYIVLGIAPDADDEAVRTSYRALVKEFHPDRAIARGLPEEAVKIATAKLAAVNAAYEQIASERGL